MTDLAYIVSHGFAARMVTQTDLLGRLAESGKKVALICPDDKDPNLSAYCLQHNIKLLKFNERGGFWSENYMFKRKYFLEDLEANPALMDKHVHATRYNTSLHPLRRIRPYYYWLIHKLIKKWPVLRQRYVDKEKENLHSDRARQLIDALAPKKLISTYPVNYNEAVLLHYGNAHPGVETWIHLLSWDNVTCKGRFPETADRYIAWGPIMKEELMQYYNVREDRIFMTGVPHFDVHIRVKQNPQHRQYVSRLGLDPDKPYLLFAMSSPRFAPGEIEIVEWLSEAVGNHKFGETQLVVRPHPQNVKGNLADLSWLPRLRTLANNPRTAVDFPEVAESKLNWSMKEEDMLRLANIITGSALVMNSGSTVCIDALLHNKPVVITAFDGKKNFSYWKSARRLIDYPHLKKLVEHKGVQIASDFESLSNVIALFVANGPGFREGERQQAILSEVFSVDDQSTGRVCSVLASDDGLPS